ncbi:hypothetical protein CBS101457_003536 [Exobasidium rhododendri]|nr:hypothetical protein CBS101457_003536 [Exobasidium rhododendri]
MKKHDSMSSVNIIMEEDKENLAPVRKQPSQYDSFLDDGSFNDSSASFDAAQHTDSMKMTPGKQGILRMPDTPGTGQKVTFGKRLYDDGDESRMSTSTGSFNASLPRSPLGGGRHEGNVSEDSVDMSLGYIRRKASSSQTSSEDRGSDIDPDRKTDEDVLVEGLETFALPNLAEYSNLEDISFGYGSRFDATLPVMSRSVKACVDSFEDLSFNESFLQAEIELAKRQMENETKQGRKGSIGAATEEIGAVTGEQTIALNNEGTAIDPKKQKEEREMATPTGANTTQISEYMSTRSQLTDHSPQSTAAPWGTPLSFQSPSPSPAHLSQEYFTETGQAYDSAMRSISHIAMPGYLARSPARGDESSPTVQRVNRRSMTLSTRDSCTPILQHLQSLTNTPARRSPLSEVANNHHSPSGKQETTLEERGPEHNLKTSFITLLSSDYSSPNTSHTTADQSIEDVLRDTMNLDEAHSKRSDLLLKRMRLAEEESIQIRQLLEAEQVTASRAISEAEAVRATMLTMKAEHEREGFERKSRLGELEKLVMKLHRQLDSQEIRTEGGEASSDQVEEQVEDGRQSVAAILESTELLEEQVNSISTSSIQWREGKREMEERIECIKRDFESQLEDREEAQSSLQSEFEAYKTSQEDAIVSLQRQLTEREEERLGLQSALISAQKQIGHLQGETTRGEGDDAGDAERHDGLLSLRDDEIEALRMKLRGSEERWEALTRENEMKSQELEESKKERIEERMMLQKKNEQLEEENDNLLQNLAEAEEHRRAMEEELISKKEVAVGQSRVREERASLVAEEMQIQLKEAQGKVEKMTARVTVLEREVGDRGLQIAKLEKAKDRLEEDNMNYSIALSSKQQELSLLKRTNLRSQRNTPTSAISNRTEMSRRIAPTTAQQSSQYLPFSSSRGLTSEMRSNADESVSVNSSLQTGPFRSTLTRRKTMDVETPSARTRVSSARVVGSRASQGRTSLAMPPPSSTSSNNTSRKLKVLAQRQKSPEEETKVIGTTSQASSRSSLQSTDGLRSSSLAQIRSASSGRDPHNPVLLPAAKKQLSSSILASEGPMDISELESSQGAPRLLQRVQDRSRDLHLARAPSPLPSKATKNLAAIPA